MKNKLLFIPLFLTLILSACGTQGGGGGGGDTPTPTPTPEKDAYTITFKDYDGSLLETKEWAKNTIPSYKYDINRDTEEWKWTFKGWAEQMGGSVITIPAATKDATYFAVVEKAKQKYTVTFNDEEGNKLQSLELEYGITPHYSYSKQDTQEWKYTMKGWSLTKGGEVLSSLPKVTGNATYFAIIEQAKQKYTVTFDSNGGSTVESITQEYGSSVAKPTDPTKDGYYFVSWCTDNTLKTAVSWPITLSKNQTVYAKWNEKVDMKGYLAALVKAIGQDPYSYIPNAMRSSNSANHVSASDVNYNFANFTNVSSIKYGGFGEQWQMVMDNIAQSEKFYAVLTLADNAISASVAAFNNWFDKNPSDTNKELNETGYYAKVNFANAVLTYTLQLKTGIVVPLFGEVLPQIDMTYNITSKEKSVRINLSDTNALRYVITDTKYVFGIEYGIDSVSRSALCQMVKAEDESVAGHIYEYITLKGKDAVKSCADFYIDKDYVSVVGNKASGIIGMDGYINELYKTSEGKLIGYKVQETKTIYKITGTYHTLWFNLNNITGINSVKVTEHTSDNDNDLNANNIYVNGESKLFKPTFNKKLTVKTSRKYDIELRTQFRYGNTDNVLTCYETKIPMMFIQDDNDKDSNYTDFPNDIKSTNDITASVNLSSTYLAKIRKDYDELIPLFKTNKDLIDSTAIKEWIGSAITK